MKKSDFIFLLVATAIFLPFFVSDDAYEWYKTFNATHGMVMSFLKFAILSTMGEMIGLRISSINIGTPFEKIIIAILMPMPSSPHTTIRGMIPKVRLI